MGQAARCARQRSVAPWRSAELAGGLAWALVSVAVFTPWFRHAPCPFTGGCAAPRTNVVGWEFGGATAYWVPVVAGVIGFAIGWGIVLLLEPRRAALTPGDR